MNHNLPSTHHSPEPPITPEATSFPTTPDPRTPDLRHPETPRSPESAPSAQFQVDPADYPIFRQQSRLASVNRSVTRPLDDTLSDYISHTADTVAAITGETADAMSTVPEAYRKPFDHIIYLDKSARPVCWMVNTFWDDFTTTKRPPHSFLAIDRANWFRYVGLESDKDGRKLDSHSEDNGRRYGLQDFLAHEDAIDPARIAGIRALYVDGGVNTTDPDAIMQLPTTLDGKRILIVDEVSRTGSTLGIATRLLQRAIPEAAAIETFELYHHSGCVINPATGESENAEVPVWYDPDSPDGRGVSDPREGFYKQRYEANPTPRNLARSLGGHVLSTFKNLAEERQHLSRELAHEIKQMRQDFDQGKILFAAPKLYSVDAWESWLNNHHLVLAGRDAAGKYPTNSYAAVKNALAARTPTP